MCVCEKEGGGEFVVTAAIVIYILDENVGGVM